MSSAIEFGARGQMLLIKILHPVAGGTLVTQIDDLPLNVHGMNAPEGALELHRVITGHMAIDTSGTSDGDFVNVAKGFEASCAALLGTRIIVGRRAIPVTRDASPNTQ